MGKYVRFEPQRVGIDEGVLTTMTDKEAVYLHLHRQIDVAFVRMVKNHGRMMERREIDTSEIDIIIGLLVSDDDSFIQHCLA